MTIKGINEKIAKEIIYYNLMSLFINLITVSRMVFRAIIFVLLTRTELYWYAFVLFFIASITDYF